MKIGVNLNCFGPLPLTEQVALMKRHGFETTFCVSDNPMFAEAYALAKREGILFENLHAPYRGVEEMWREGEAGEDFLNNKLLAAVQTCAAYQIPVLVVHLSSIKAHVNDLGYVRFAKLIEEARRLGVTLAFENLRTLGGLALLMEDYPELSFCWDVGHETCFIDGVDFMSLYGTRTAALHLQDNFCEHNKDLHLIPYDGAIDMDRAAKKLAESGYTGSIMLELIRSKWEGYAEMTPDEYYGRAADAARKFGARMEKYRA